MKECQPIGVMQSGCSHNRGSFPSIVRPYIPGSARLADSNERILTRSFSTLLALLLLVALGGCGSLHLNPDPEVAPSERVDAVWTPPHSVTQLNDPLSTLRRLRQFNEESAVKAAGGQGYDLSSLVDLALKTNPQTRRAWYVAREAAAQLGQSEAPIYPKVEADAPAGYEKLPIQFPGQTLIIRNEALLPQIKLSYDLLDFGRSRATERSARERLIAANFAFNQALQDIVFNVERAYYVLSAANASVSAAQANLKLARTSLSAVEDRHQVGLATQPQVLLAKQVVAQGVYEFENAKSMVHNAEAGLYQSLGVAADTNLRIQSARLDRLPTNLDDDVEKLMADALKHRPDIGAQIAAVRADDAEFTRARSEFYPEAELSGNYGQVIWSYTINGGHTQNLNQPFYGALFTLRWDLFTGFDRYYGVQKASAERNLARSELRSLQLNVIEAVWTAYYDYLSAKKKRDASMALVTASEESYQANLQSHQHGLATITDLVTTERDLMVARYTLIQSETDLLVSSAALLHASGASSESSTSTH